jgi:hypothetical protein
MGTHTEQRQPFDLKKLPATGKLNGKTVQLADVEMGVVPIIEREKIEVTITAKQAAAIGIDFPAGGILRPWRERALLEVDDETGKIVDVDAAFVGTGIPGDAAPPFSWAPPKTRADLELLGGSDETLERLYLDLFGKRVVLHGLLDTPQLQSLRGRVYLETSTKDAR